MNVVERGHDDDESDAAEPRSCYADLFLRELQKVYYRATFARET